VNSPHCYYYYYYYYYYHYYYYYYYHYYYYCWYGERRGWGGSETGGRDGCGVEKENKKRKRIWASRRLHREGCREEAGLFKECKSSTPAPAPRNAKGTRSPKLAANPPDTQQRTPATVLGNPDQHARAHTRQDTTRHVRENA
jgi:hypothetical protein